MTARKSKDTGKPGQHDTPAVHCQHSAMVKIEDLRPHPRTPNKHGDEQIALLAKNIRHLGWRHPILVSAMSGYIVAGHARLEAAKVLNLAAVPVDAQPFASEAEEHAYLLADNRIAELADLQAAAVKDLLEELDTGAFDMDLTGYTAEALEGMMTETADPPDEAEKLDSKADELQAKWQTAPGQLWTAGQHRVLCGDATDPACWARLMNGEKAVLCNTDPPYGVSYAADQGRMIKGDGKREDDLLTTLLSPALKLAVEHTTPDAPFYVWHAMATRRDFEQALDSASLLEKQYITWVKDALVLGRADYHWQTEPAFYCQKYGQSCRWLGDRKQTTVWRVRPPSPAHLSASIANGVRLSDGTGNQVYLAATAPKNRKTRLIRLGQDEAFYVQNEHTSDAWEIARDPAKERLHPTQKPVKLFDIPIQNHTAENDLIVEPFAGGGGQFIAAQRSGRRCYGMDLDPKYVAVVLERLMQEGLLPKLEEVPDVKADTRSAGGKNRNRG